MSGLSGPHPGRTDGVVERLLEMASVPAEPAELRLQKRLQISMAVASVVFVGLWGVSFLFVGRLDAAVQPFAYCAGTVLMLVHLRLTRRYDLFRWAHTALVLLGPFMLHLYLGGFAGSGGAMMWSLIAPVAAMMFVGARASLAWMLVLIVMLGIGVAREQLFPAARPLTPLESSFYFAFNTAGMVVFLYFSTRYFTGRIRAEQGRADKLLLNILPAPIAERLKRRTGIIAERFDAVTVVFGDLVGFTGLSQTLQAGQLVKLLDEIFSDFDRLAEQHGLEKIKTIGDAYMVVAGLPDPCSDHAVRAASMALGMREVIRRFAQARGLPLDMRIGLHTGEVVAGVIGQKKFTYDLWGDTVNTASRMESHGEPGRVHVSAATKRALEGSFTLTPRGAITVKGKGEMETYWLDA